MNDMRSRRARAAVCLALAAAPACASTGAAGVEAPWPVLVALLGGAGALGFWVRRLQRRLREQVDRTHAVQAQLQAARADVAVRDGALRETLDQTVRALSTVAVHRDLTAAGHDRRVGELAVAIGHELGMAADDLEGLQMAAAVHDIGQIRLPAEILTRAGPLTREEFALVRLHPDAGREILAPIRFPWPVAEIVHQHHENVDGSGYPRGLAGDQILPAARVLRVADAHNAMRSHRPYRRALEPAQAAEQLRAGCGRLFDPAAVGACLRVLARGEPAAAPPPAVAAPRPTQAPELPPLNSVEERAFHAALTAVAAVLEQRDAYTAGHQQAVATLAARIAAELGLDAVAIRTVFLSGLVHDLGKIRVPAEILGKPARLNDAENALMRQHPEAGSDILRRIELPWPIAEIVHQHHEYLDGSGYPRGLRGAQILLEARILTVADIVESMASDRPYRPAVGLADAIGAIVAMRGTRLEPAVVDACVAVLSRGEFTPRALPGTA